MISDKDLGWNATWNNTLRTSFVSLWRESRRQRTPRSYLQKTRWQATTAQHAERHHMEIVWKSEHPFSERTVGSHQRRRQTTGRRDTHPVVMRKMPHLGCDSFGHIRKVTSGNNINRSGRGRKPGSRRQDTKIRHNHPNACFCGGCIRVQRFLEF